MFINDESKTKETLRLTQFTLDHSPDAVYWMDPKGRFVYVNKTACRTLGYTREELLTMGVADIDPSLPDGVPPKISEATKKAGFGRLETEHRTKDGRIIPVEVMVAYIEYEGKEYHCSFVRDITERKRAEEALRESEKELRLQGEIINNMAEGTHIVSVTDGTIIYANPTLEDMFGYEPGHLNGKNVSILNDPNDKTQDNIVGEVLEALSRDGSWKGEVHNVKKDGTRFNSQATVSTFNHPQYGNVAITVQSDITERKRADEELEKYRNHLEELIKERTSELRREILKHKKIEKKLARSETKHRTLFESSTDAVMLLDKKAFFDCNEATLHIFGCKLRNEFLEKHPSELSPPIQPDGTDSMTLANKRIATAYKKGANQFEWMHRRLDGSDFPAEVWLTRMKLDGKDVLQATVRDITKRKLAEG